MSGAVTVVGRDIPKWQRELVPDWDLTAELIQRVDEVADVLEAKAAESDSGMTLPAETVDALHHIGAFALRAPVEVGGYELSVLGQLLVAERIAEHDAAAAWCAMISNGASGTVAQFFGDAAVERVFAGGRVPPMAGVAQPKGVASKAPGGYVVNGDWQFSSNIRNAEWVNFRASLEDDPEGRIMAVVPKEHLAVHDSWDVGGLRGTGSCDFTVRDLFVPQEMTIVPPPVARQRRGVRSYEKLDGAIIVYEHVGVALGLGRRSLAELAGVLQSGRLDGRDELEGELGRLTLWLDSAEALVMQLLAEADDTSQAEFLADESRRISLELKLKAQSTVVHEVSQMCAEAAYRRAGTRALRLPNPIERATRDIKAALAHLLMNDKNYAVYAAALLEGATTEFRDRHFKL